MPVLTNKNKKRARQRAGITKNNLDTIASRAFREGIKHSEAIGLLRAWMNSEYLKYKSANNCRLYANKLYIFHNDILITIVNAPVFYEQSLYKYVRSYKIYIKYKMNRISHKSDLNLRNELITEIQPVIFKELRAFIKDIGKAGDFEPSFISNMYQVNILFKNKDQEAFTKVEQFLKQEYDMSCIFKRNKQKKEQIK